MGPARIASLGILVLLSLLMIHPGPVSAATSHNYSILVTEGKVPVSISLNVVQNLTLIQASFALPEVRSVLEGANSSQVAQQIQAALQAKTPLAKVADFALEVSSSSWSNSTSQQSFNITLTFTVLGVSRSSGGVEQADLSWRSFNIPSNITVSGVELNSIGERYLVQPAQQLSTLTLGNQFIRVAFQVNGRPVNGLFLASFARTINTLNFTGLTRPVSTWKGDYDFGTSTQGWSLNPGQVLGMQVTRSIQEAENITTTSYGVFYSLNARVSAPGRASASGDTVSVDFNYTPEKIMGVSILALASIGLGAFVYERRILRRSPGKAKKNRPKS